MNRNAIIGAIVWFCLLVASRLNKPDLDWIELLFLFAPLVILPLAHELTTRVEQGLAQPSPERIARLIQPLCALATTAAFFLPQGWLTASLAVPWLICCALLALGGAIRFYNGAVRHLDAALPAVALLYLPVGGAWFVASRLGLTPMNFQEPIVLLTAVHFHYAGFAAPLLMRCARLVLAQSRMRASTVMFINSIAMGVLLGPGMLAAGFIVGPRVKLASALVLAASETGLAFCFLLALRRTDEWTTRVLIGLASASVMFSMVLAALWAVGEYPLQSFVHLAQMARLHGTANAFGFTFCGLLGWLRPADRIRWKGGASVRPHVEQDKIAGLTPEFQSEPR